MSPVPWVPGFPHPNPSPASDSQDKLALISKTRRSSRRPSTHPGASQLRIPSPLWGTIHSHQVPARHSSPPEGEGRWTFPPPLSHLLCCACFSGQSNRRVGSARRAFAHNFRLKRGVRLCFSLTQFHILRSQACTSHVQAAQIGTLRAQERARLEERQQRGEPALQKAG